MNRFWGGVGLLVVIGALAAFTAGGQKSNLIVNDLETECRGDRASRATMELHTDNSMSFRGYFPVENTNSNLRYEYSKTGDSIKLNVKSQNLAAPPTFWNSCLASAVYDFDTKQLEEGRYAVTIRHNGERAEKKIIRVE
ncbi:MAG: hypothetical protein ABEK16_02930 [Candidatus Nanohalobium sp.]